MENLMKKLEQTKTYIEGITKGRKIQIGLVLGSGLGDLADQITDPIFISYEDIPNFPVSTVEGHAGRLVIGNLEGKSVICMQGRFHYYEGYEMDQVVFPIQTMRMLGVEYLILTNAAGCINTAWKPGDLMLITDHIKLAHSCPLRGPNPKELGPRFFDMSKAYDPDLADIVRKQAKGLGINLREGVYMFFAGPNYETPAEIRAARILGADAAGMSTVPEAIAAAHCGFRTIGISCMTNMAAGILKQALNHQEVIETSLMVKKDFTALVKSLLRAL